MRTLRPMLAGKAPADLERIRYPVLVSAKLDGVRALIVNGQVLSRTLKLIPNRYVQHVLGKEEFSGLDGELIVGNPNNNNCLQHTMSGVMSIEGEPDFAYFVFDKWDRQVSFETMQVQLALSERVPPFIITHPHKSIFNYKQLETFESEVLDAGYEGLILRDPKGPYKFNRSTTKEGWMLKLKRYEQDEAVIIGFEELLHNDNEPELDERGYTKRATVQAHKHGGDKLGAFFCKLLDRQTKIPIEGSAFSVGTGFTDEQRIRFWRDRDELFGKIITVKHFAQQGVKDALRHPVFISFREKIDL